MHQSPDWSREPYDTSNRTWPKKEELDQLGGEKTVNEAELEDELSIKKEGGEERREIDEVKWVRVERKDDKQAI